MHTYCSAVYSISQVGCLREIDISNNPICAAMVILTTVGVIFNNNRPFPSLSISLKQPVRNVL